MTISQLQAFRFSVGGGARYRFVSGRAAFGRAYGVFVRHTAVVTPSGGAFYIFGDAIIR